MFTLWFMALLCLLPLSQAAPLDCGALVKPLAQVDPGHYEGKWILVADSLRVNEGPPAPIPPTSFVVRISNSTFTQGIRIGAHCAVLSKNVSWEGPKFHVIDRMLTINGTLYQTSCPDCMLMGIDVDSPSYKSNQMTLFSRRREVEQKELEEFRDQLECLKMPPHIVMDPKIELCL